MTNNPPTVSVIMAVYNTGAFVGDAIASILNQTYTDFECIIVNDGSTDNGLSVIQSYKDKRIKVINQPNKGVVYSRNLAIKKATGKYIAIMDSDDVSTPDRLQQQVDFLDTHPDIIAVGGQLLRCDIHLNPVKTWHYPTQVIRSHRRPYDFTYNMPHGCAMVRREYIKKVPYRPYFWAAEDYDMLLRLWDMGDFANIPHTVLYYRWHDKNIRLSMRVWRSVMSVVSANMCTVLRRTNRSDSLFDNIKLSRENGFLLHKTYLYKTEIVYAVYNMVYKSIKQVAILMVRKILHKK